MAASDAVFTAENGVDVQTTVESSGQRFGLSLIQVGPRGGVRVVKAMLTEQERRELIEMLGGTP